MLPPLQTPTLMPRCLMMRTNNGEPLSRTISKPECMLRNGACVTELCVVVIPNRKKPFLRRGMYLNVRVLRIPTHQNNNNVAAYVYPAILLSTRICSLPLYYRRDRVEDARNLAWRHLVVLQAAHLGPLA